MFVSCKLCSNWLFLFKSSLNDPVNLTSTVIRAGTVNEVNPGVSAGKLQKWRMSEAETTPSDG